MKKYFIAFVAFMMATTSSATQVAVTDSGTDFSHAWLNGRALINAKEVAGNRVDDDRNGKVDDIMGWNFVEGYGRIFFPEHLQSVDPTIFKYFEVIARIQSDAPTREDEQFWQDNVSNLKPEDKKRLEAKLNFYGQYAHSTHVSGIIAALSPNSKIMSNRVFPDTPPEAQVMSWGEGAKANKKFGPADIFYKILSALNNGSFNQVGLYLKERQIDVANYSLGVSLQNLAKLILGLRGIKEPTPEQLSKETQRAGAQFMPEGNKWMASSPGTLFVVAAGNDGTDNDALPTFPANVRAPNSITVAATNGVSKLAKFSNYGAKSVDIAAPGVAIVSSVPALDRKQVLPMSGTSMASPYVAGVAAKVKEINPRLTSSELRKVLMATVDHKDWLKGKVISEGVVNPDRAYAAAEKSKTISLDEAIKAAQAEVKDQVEALLPAGPKSRSSSEMQTFAQQFVF